MSKHNPIFDLLGREEGQTMSEYALTLALVVLAVVGVITQLSNAIDASIAGVASKIAGLAP